MSMIGEAFAAVRRLMLMDSEIERMKNAIEDHDDRIRDQNERLIRVEAVMDFVRPYPPRPPRLPKG